ncbi:gastric triacylglycerol lipase-like protein, partial [Leptotrombidium deliense]
TLIMFALLSERPEYAEIVKPFIALAPVAKVGHIKSPIRYLAENPLLMDFFYYKGGAFFPSSDLINYMAEQFCKFEVIADLCSNILFLFAGYDSTQLNITRLPVYVAHVPSTTSAWNVIHFGQMVVSNKFRKFDFGTIGNLRHYGTTHPPEYNMSRITSENIAIIHSMNDWLGDPEDVLFIQQQLEGKLIVDHKIPYEKWNHLDFLWAKKTAKYVNVVVIDILKKFKSETCLNDNLV